LLPGWSRNDGVAADRFRQLRRLIRPQPPQLADGDGQGARATIRYARKIGWPIRLVLPDGTVHEG
jgi:hypothetical protein